MMKKLPPEQTHPVNHALKAFVAGVEKAHDEREILAMIEQRVQELLDTNCSLLFSHLYRMDIDEGVVRALLDRPPADQTVSQALAALIWQRQKQRMYTRRRIEVVDDDIPPEMCW